MEKMILNGASWKLQILGENIYGITQEEMPAVIPGSVYGNLLSRGLIPDPYDGRTVCGDSGPGCREDCSCTVWASAGNGFSSGIGYRQQSP